MYMNVNGVLADQRLGLSGWPAWWRSMSGPCGVRRQLLVRLARVSVSCWQGLPGARPAEGLWVCVGCSLRPLACRPFMSAWHRWGQAGERTPSLPDPGMIRGVVPGYHRIYVAWRRRSCGTVVWCLDHVIWWQPQWPVSEL